MARTVISPEEGTKLERLKADYLVASARAARALMTGGTPLEGEALQRAIDEDAKVSAIVRQISSRVPR